MCVVPTRPYMKDAARYEPGGEECGSVLSRRDGRPVVALWCYGDRATRLDARCQAKKAAGAPIANLRRMRVEWRRGKRSVGLHVAELAPGDPPTKACASTSAKSCSAAPR